MNCGNGKSVRMSVVNFILWINWLSNQIKLLCLTFVMESFNHMGIELYRVVKISSDDSYA